MRKIIKRELDEKLKPLYPSSEGATKVESPSEANSPKHETIEELVACPDCYPKIEPLVLKKHWKQTKDLSHECTECGSRVKGEESEKEDWECKTCGNKYAKER